MNLGGSQPSELSGSSAGRHLEQKEFEGKEGDFGKQEKSEGAWDMNP